MGVSTNANEGVAGRGLAQIHVAIKESPLRVVANDGIANKRFAMKGFAGTGVPIRELLMWALAKWVRGKPPT